MGFSTGSPMRNIDALNERLLQYTLPTHRAQIPDSFANIEWLRKNLPKHNNVDEETMRLLNMASFTLTQRYQGEGGGD